MRVVILGGSGLIGKALEKELSENHDVECLNRSAFKSIDTLSSLIKDSDLVIQLSGSTIAKRWTKRHLKEVWESRVDTTEMLSKAISVMPRKPRVMCASGVSFYPQSNCDNPFSEGDKEGDGYLSELSIAWESAAKSISPDTIVLRFGVVLSRSGGAFMKLYWPYFFGFGGPIANGSQCFSWVHLKDLVRSVNFIINDSKASGVYNITAPEPIPQKIFGKALSVSLRRPFLVPLWEWQLKLLFGSGSQILTESISVIPKRLLQEGFVFDYPDISSAMSDLI
jgi:uncharacterized protein (TIGR01777 family)